MDDDYKYRNLWAHKADLQEAIEVCMQRLNGHPYDEDAIALQIEQLEEELTEVNAELERMTL